MCSENKIALLLAKICDADLYLKLISQLNKDFEMVGLENTFDVNYSPNDLVKKLQEQLIDLIRTDFDTYANLLYRIDVSELALKKLDNLPIENLTLQVTYVVLKREWQKVWFKNKL
jgi:hypothetical protein